MAFHMVPGLSLAIVREGKPVEVRTYGMANIEAPSKVHKESVFKIGSLSKQFLATDIMLLQQDGKLNIADPISKYIQDVPESWRSITIRHVLNHSAGFVGEPLNWDAIEKRPLIDYIRSNYQEPLLSKSGEKNLYSNFGYFVIAEIVNRVSGKSWDAFTEERIFRPVGMKRSFVNHFWRVVPGRAMGYETNYRDDPMTGENALENGFNYYSQRPSGGFISTAVDLAKWEIALRGGSILTEESKRQMFSPLQIGTAASQYGLGWEISAKAGHPVVRHNGSVPGFRSSMQRYMRDDLTVIVLCNNGGAPVEDLGERITELLLPELKSTPPRAISAGSTARFNVVKRFMETRTVATPDPRLMTEACIANLNWKAGARRFMGFGKLIKLTRIEKRERDSEAVWRYRVLFERTEIDALVEFQDDRISDIAIVLA